MAEGRAADAASNDEQAESIASDSIDLFVHLPGSDGDRQPSFLDVTYEGSVFDADAIV